MFLIIRAPPKNRPLKSVFSVHWFGCVFVHGDCHDAPAIVWMRWRAKFDVPTWSQRLPSASDRRSGGALANIMSFIIIRTVLIDIIGMMLSRKKWRSTHRRWRGTAAQLFIYVRGGGISIISSLIGGRCTHAAICNVIIIGGIAVLCRWVRVSGSSRVLIFWDFHFYVRVSVSVMCNCIEQNNNQSNAMVWR